MSEELANSIRAAGWRQGSTVPHQAVADGAVASLTSDRLGEHDLLVVVSQDCDVVTPPPDDQPDVELAVLRRIDTTTIDNMKLYRKHPRRLHLRHGDAAYEAWTRARHWMSRSALAEYAPDTHLDEAVTTDLAHWFADVYIRPAFPDEFNNRARTKDSAIRTKLKSASAADVSGMYLAVDPDGEIPDGTDYQVLLVGTMESHAFKDPKRRTAAQTVVDDVAAKLSSCPGIVVAEAHLKAEAEVSLDDLRYLRRWDAPDMSYREGPTGESAPRA